MERLKKVKLTPLNCLTALSLLAFIYGLIFSIINRNTLNLAPLLAAISLFLGLFTLLVSLGIKFLFKDFAKIVIAETIFLFLSVVAFLIFLVI